MKRVIFEIGHAVVSNNEKIAAVAQRYSVSATTVRRYMDKYSDMNHKRSYAIAHLIEVERKLHALQIPLVDDQRSILSLSIDSLLDAEQ